MYTLTLKTFLKDVADTRNEAEANREPVRLVYSIGSVHNSKIRIVRKQTKE